MGYRIAFRSGYTEPDPAGVFSPSNSRGLFRADSLARHLLQ
jgi:hypothetical protein